MPCSQILQTLNTALRSEGVSGRATAGETAMAFSIASKIGPVLRENSSISTITMRGGGILVRPVGAVPLGSVPASRQHGGSSCWLSPSPHFSQHLVSWPAVSVSPHDSNPGRKIVPSYKQNCRGLPTAGINIPKHSKSKMVTKRRTVHCSPEGTRGQSSFHRRCGRVCHHAPRNG